MLAIKDEINSNEIVNYYDVDARRFIAVQHTPSGRVEEIRLVYVDQRGEFARFTPKGILYLDQLSEEYEDEGGESVIIYDNANMADDDVIVIINPIIDY